MIREKLAAIWNKLPAFRNDTAGAITVDWIVITAAMVLLSAAMVSSVRTGATDLVEDLSVVMGAKTPE